MKKQRAGCGSWRGNKRLPLGLFAVNREGGDAKPKKIVIDIFH